MPGVCARCSRNVYFAEQRVALGLCWHVFCFSCYSCRKLLDSCTVVPHCKELYCKPCHARLFANGSNRFPQVTTPTSLTACSGGTQCAGPPCPSCPPCTQPSLCSRCRVEPCRCQEICEPKSCYNSGNCCIRRPTRTDGCQSRPAHRPRSRSPSSSCPSCNQSCTHFKDRLCPIQQVCSPMNCEAPTSRETAAYYNRQHNASKSTSCCSCGGCIPCPGECQQLFMPCESCCEPPECPPCEKQCEGPCERPCEKACERSSERPCEKPCERSCEKPCERHCGDHCKPCVSPNKCRRPPSGCCRNQTLTTRCGHCPNESSNTSACKKPLNNLGGGASCRRCQRPVYPAELMLAAGGCYHNCCFNCLCCKQPLEVRSFVEGAGEIYCKQCWNSLCCKACQNKDSNNNTLRLRAGTNYCMASDPRCPDDLQDDDDGLNFCSDLKTSNSRYVDNNKTSTFSNICAPLKNSLQNKSHSFAADQTCTEKKITSPLHQCCDLHDSHSESIQSIPLSEDFEEFPLCDNCSRKSNYRLVSRVHSKCRTNRYHYKAKPNYSLPCKKSERNLIVGGFLCKHKRHRPNQSTYHRPVYSVSAVM